MKIPETWASTSGDSTLSGPSDFPQSNALVRLYAMTSRDMSPDREGANVVFLDPATGAAVYSVRDGEALTDAFEARYLGRTLGEVKAG